MAARRKNVELMGSITAFDWDDDNNVNRVSLCVDDDEYLIDDDNQGKELIKLIDAKIKAKGKSYLDENKNYCLKVEQFTIL